MKVLKLMILNQIVKLLFGQLHPWTIPANKALAYNKDLDYTVIEIKK